MKQPYQKPEIDCTLLAAMDILITSGSFDTPTTDDDNSWGPLIPF